MDKVQLLQGNHSLTAAEQTARQKKIQKESKAIET